MCYDSAATTRRRGGAPAGAPGQQGKETTRIMAATPTGLDIRACIFDVFGTVVDWRSSIIEQCANLGRIKGIERDWGAFADAWRGKYRPYMDKVRHGELPWTNLDALHRDVSGRGAGRV